MTVASPRLTRADWLEAGQEILRTQGAAGVKLKPLLQQLGVTTGSFYHHFRDIHEYRDALADHYGAQGVERLIELAGDLHGGERLTEMWQKARELDIPALDRAMRIWATTNERAQAAVEKQDVILLGLMESAFVDLGYDAEEAQVRARLVLAAGVGNAIVFSPWPEDLQLFERALQIIVAPPR